MVKSGPAGRGVALLVGCCPGHLLLLVSALMVACSSLLLSGPLGTRVASRTGRCQKGVATTLRFRDIRCVCIGEFPAQTGSNEPEDQKRLSQMCTKVYHTFSIQPKNGGVFPRYPGNLSETTINRARKLEKHQQSVSRAEQRAENTAENYGMETRTVPYLTVSYEYCIRNYRGTYSYTVLYVCTGFEQTWKIRRVSIVLLQPGIPAGMPVPPSATISSSTGPERLELKTIRPPKVQYGTGRGGRKSPDPISPRSQSFRSRHSNSNWAAVRYGRAGRGVENPLIPVGQSPDHRYSTVRVLVMVRYVQYSTRTIMGIWSSRTD